MLKDNTIKVSQTPGGVTKLEELLKQTRARQSSILKIFVDYLSSHELTPLYGKVKEMQNLTWSEEKNTSKKAFAVDFLWLITLRYKTV